MERTVKNLCACWFTVVALTSCGDASNVDEAAARQAALTWVNTTGLNQQDLDVWMTRLTELCGALDESSRIDLIDGYRSEDQSLSLGDGNTIDTPSLTTMLVTTTCP